MIEPKRADRVPLTGWQPIASGGTELRLNSAAARVPALRMDFDFRGGGGFVVARRPCSRAMPREYSVSFRLRGCGPSNHLELKLVDSTGLNVWRHVIKDLEPTTHWRKVAIPGSDIEFAWGPSSGGEIAQLGYLELAVVAGQGGKGTLWIADLEIEDCTALSPPQAVASSEVAGFEAAHGLSAPGWKPQPTDPRPWIVIDAHERRLFGGLVIDWPGGAPAGGFRVRISDTGRRFRTVYQAARAGGARSNVYLPGLRARFIRVELGGPCAGAIVRPQPFDFSRSIDAFWYSIAKSEPRAWHPRWLHREQSLWTPIGTSNGTHCALMNEDGMVEVQHASFSIEPMLLIGGCLTTWTDVSPRQELLEGFLPVPAVVWETPGWRMRIAAHATVNGGLCVRYRIENLTRRPEAARLFILVRPFQVTPPWQKFRNAGGTAPIHELSWSEGAVLVNGSMRLEPAANALGFGCMAFDEGCIVPLLAAGTLPAATCVHDRFGFAAGALDLPVQLAPDESAELTLNCMPRDATHAPAFDWRSELPVGQWSGEGWAADVILAALTAAAHILVTRCGPALQPGPRRYTRSWIRDGAMMGAALLRMRHTSEVREFIRWYAPHQRADGFVPCCVDGEGIDWLVEHDSHGQLIALIADYHRFTSDRPFLEESWQYVVRAAGCIEGLLGADGLLPVSVSHEGYLAQPVHSYWDDFWALRGLLDAAGLAGVLGHPQAARRWDAIAGRLSKSLCASISSTRAHRNLDFIPGSVEWADFDPTATANALYLFDVPEGLERAPLERTFDIYLADWRAKRAGAVAQTNYTPYEIRIIGALVKLGRREAALELLRFFLSDRRPLAWNQWPEIAWRDPLAPAHLGDLPHTWISAEYVLAVRSLFAYERTADASLVIGAGLAPQWLEGQGVRVSGMPTAYGDLSYSLRRLDANTLQFDIDCASAQRVILRPPLPGALRAVTINGIDSANFDRDSVWLGSAPAHVRCTTL
jgi:hypothetical protein